MAMAQPAKARPSHTWPNYSKAQGRLFVVLDGLCMAYGYVIWAYGHYTTPNHLNARLRLPARVISLLIPQWPLAIVFSIEHKA